MAQPDPPTGYNQLTIDGWLFSLFYQEKGKAKITKYSGKDFTKVTFYPDLKRFGMAKLDKVGGLVSG